MNDRMFHVLVLGGLALVGCGGSVVEASTGDGAPQDAAANDSTFPSETNAGTQDGADVMEAGFSDATPTGPRYGGSDGSFPSELPPPPPTGDAPVTDAGASEYADVGTADGHYVPSELPQ